MQVLLDRPVKPVFSRSNRPGILPVTAWTATSLGGEGASIFVSLSWGVPVKYTDPDGRVSLFGFELFQIPQTGDPIVDAVYKIEGGLLKVLLGKLITDGSIGGGAALTGLSSGVATVAGVGIAVAGSAVGTAISAEGLADIVEGSLSLMQGNGNDHTRRDGEAKQIEKTQIEGTATRYKIDPYKFGEFVEEEKDAIGRPNSQNFSWQELQELAARFKAENGVE
jgi:hypothetical protein